MKKLTLQIAKKCKQKNTLITNTEKRNKIALASRNLSESLLRLKERHEELKETEKALAFFDPKRNGSLNDIQLKFYNKTEAFHQAIYASISNLINLLNNIAQRSIVTQMPINSNSKFLTFIDKQFSHDDIQDNIPVILESVNYRSIIVDHPQNNKAYDWMTYYYNGEVVIIHIPDKKHEIIFVPQLISPYSKDFTPPLKNCDDFFIAPNYQRVYKAYIKLVENILKYV
jgi:hypothetical protein